MLPTRARVTRGLIAVKEYFAIPRSLEQEPYTQMQFNEIPRTHLFGGRGSYSSAGDSQHTLNLAGRTSQDSVLRSYFNTTNIIDATEKDFSILINKSAFS